MTADDLRLVVVDDHVLFRRGLAELLRESGFRVVAEAGDGADALPVVQRERPDVVVMDLSMPRVSGIEATQQIVATCPGIAVLVLTVSPNEDDVLDALTAGASGYLLKDAGAEEIARAVRAAAAGDSALSPRVAARLVERERQRARQRPATSLAADLSERELEVVRLIAQGLANDEIAERLYLSPKTVKNQVSAILVKLGVENRVQAAVLAVRAGLA